MILGGLSQVRPVDEEVTEIVKSIKKIFESKNYQSSLFEPKIFKKQIVNGSIFFVKIETDKGFVHSKIYQSLNGNIEYMDSQVEKEALDEIVFF